MFIVLKVNEQMDVDPDLLWTNLNTGKKPQPGAERNRLECLQFPKETLE